VRKRSPEDALLSSYGELFRELAAGGHESWRDYLAGEARPFAGRERVSINIRK